MADEYALVGKVVEDAGEVGAAIVGVGEFEAGVVEQVAQGDDALVPGGEAFVAEHDQIVLAAGFERGQGAADLVEVDHQADLVRGDRLSRKRVLQLAGLYHPPEGFGAGQVHPVGVEGNEDDALSVCLADEFHGGKHFGDACHGHST